MKLIRSTVLGGLGLGLLSCTSQPPNDAPQTFAVAAPGRADAAYEREYVGEVRALRRADVRTRTKGRIEAVAVDEGQPVTEGQLLFSLSNGELHEEMRKARAIVASAAAELQGAQTERASTKILLDKDIVSPAEIALLDAKIQTLAAKLDEAKAAERQAVINLGYAEVRAPFGGVVNRLPKKEGSLVDDGDLLTTVTDASEVLVYFRVPESEYLEYAATNGNGRSKDVGLVLANGERLPGAGVMDAVETEIDRSTGTIAFRARFKNEGNRLKHGSTGKVLVKSQLTDAITVPQKSTFEVQDHLYVYVVDADGTARARRIVPRLRLEDTFVVASGIAPDERFILEGIQMIRDGTRVAVRPDGLVAAGPGH
jgi:membrane fusion protein (multidrug efflux system)